jgi:hypothetical protein
VVPDGELSVPDELVVPVLLDALEAVVTLVTEL